MGIKQVPSNLGDLRNTLVVRSGIALTKGNPSKSGDTTDRALLKTSPFVLMEPSPYKKSATFDRNGDFQLPRPYGAAIYQAVEANSRLNPPGSIISVYA
ncbi:MAG TPA: hypothetical protein VGJ94_14265 [Syntrophorhabdaceae bacterium]